MRHSTHSALAFLVFLVGLIAGTWFFHERYPADSSIGTRHGSARAENATAAAETARSFPSDEEMLTAIMSAVADEEPLRRSHRLHKLLDRLTSAEFAVLFDRTTQVEDQERRSEILRALLARWAVVGPAAAFAAVRPYRDRLRAMTHHPYKSLEAAVDAAWTRASPRSALADAMAAPDAPWAQSTAREAMVGIAEDDPVRQLDTLAGLPASRLRSALCETSILQLATTDSAAAEARLDLILEPRKRSRVHGEILGRLTERDPEAGLARLAELAPDLTSGIGSIQLVTAVLLVAGKKDSSAALAALDNLPEELRMPALGATLTGWAEQSPIDALQWALENGVNVNEAKAITDFFDDGNGAWRTPLHAAMDKDRDNTLAWMRTLPESPDRDALLMHGIWRGTPEDRLAIYADLTPEGRIVATGQIVNSFGNDNDRAVAWINSLPPGPERNSAISAFAGGQVSSTLGQAAVIGDRWPAGPERDTALSAIAWNVAKNDAGQGLDFADRVGDATKREGAFASIANTWLGLDEPAARAWLSATPELSAEEKRVILRQFDQR
jgi:hypothetical protein